MKASFTILIIGILLLYNQPLQSQYGKINIPSYIIRTSVLTPADTSLEFDLSCEIQRADTADKILLLFSSSTKINKIMYNKFGWFDGNNDKDTWIDIPYSFAGQDSLILEIPKGINYSKHVLSNFNYKFPISPLDSGLIMLDRGNKWYPIVVDGLSTFYLNTGVPIGYSVLSAGNLILEEITTDGLTSFIWESKSPVFKIPLIVFKNDSYKKSIAAYDDKEIQLYSYSLSSDTAMQILLRAGEMFTFCKNNIGLYNNDKLTLIELSNFVNMNIGSGILEIGSSSIEQMKAGYFDGLNMSIAHQWFGSGVFSKFGSPGFWFLSLSLPHYIPLMYLRQTKGEEVYNEAIQGLFEKYNEIAGKENDVAIIDVDFPNTKEKGLVLYTKGPYIFSRLNYIMGDEQWLSFLQNLYKDYLGKIITFDDFRVYLSKYDIDGKAVTYLDKSVKEKGLPD